MTSVYKIFQQDMDLKGLLEVAGVDTTQGKAKALLEAKKDKKCSCGCDPKKCTCKSDCDCGCNKD